MIMKEEEVVGSARDSSLSLYLFAAAKNQNRPDRHDDEEQ